jgi:hypothetical protein
MKPLVVASLVLMVNLMTDQPSQAQTLQEASQPQKVQSVLQPDLAEDSQFQNWLNDGPGAPERLLALGVDRETAKEFADSFGPDDLKMVWKSVNSGAEAGVAVMFLPCDGLSAANLFALKKDKSGWKATDRVGLDCHYDDSVSMDVTQVRSESRNEILIHHVCEERGTGFVQQNLKGFSLIQGKLKLVLDTPEVLDDVQFGKKPHELKERSTFAIIPVIGSRSRVIEQTRSQTLNGRLIVQRRIFRWDAAKGCYRPSPFSPVEAAPRG